MSSENGPLLVSRDGPVAILTLSRPERLNAVSLPMYRALTTTLEALDQDADVRSVVITGAGRAFCVGADLKAHGEGPPEPGEREAYVRAAQRVNWLIQTLSRPVVAAVNGHAIGGGLEMALSSDFMIVAREAKLRFPEVSIGTFVGGGVVYTLTQRVGLLKARELILVGDFFTGEDAAAMGIANRAVPAADVLTESLALARDLAAKAPIPMAHAKRLLNGAPGLSRRRLMELEAEALLDCMGTRDWHEGIAAFHEKREPRFTGE